MASKSPWHRHAVCAALGLAVLCPVAVPLRAQAVDNDYYAGRDTELLRNVERYHVIPAREKIREKLYSYALQDIKFVLRYFPNHPEGLRLIVELCTEQKTARCDLDVVFEKAIAVNPNVVDTYVAQGIYLHRVKRYADAIGSYKHALALDSDSMNAHYNLALAYLETKQYGAANEEAQRAYALGAPLPGLRARLQQAGQWKPPSAPPGGERSGSSGDPVTVGNAASKEGSAR